MKNKTAAFILGGVLLAAALFAAETYIVKVRTTALRSGPKFFASQVLSLNAGEALLLLKKEEEWLQVKTPAGKVGWIHLSAVEPRKVDILAWDTTARKQATGSEVALAAKGFGRPGAKGFNKNVEDGYKARNKSISFVWVDKMSLLSVNRSQLETFLKQGRLGEFGGAR